MSKTFTCESKELRGCRCIELYGDKAKQVEGASQIIWYPGGHIELTRTMEDEYWAHIAVNKGQVLEDLAEQDKRGTICDSRLDYEAGQRLPYQEMTGKKIPELPSHHFIEHLAVRIRTTS